MTQPEPEMTYAEAHAFYLQRSRWAAELWMRECRIWRTPITDGRLGIWDARDGEQDYQAHNVEVWQSGGRIKCWIDNVPASVRSDRR